MIRRSFKVSLLCACLIAATAAHADKGDFISVIPQAPSSDRFAGTVELAPANPPSAGKRAPQPPPEEPHGFVDRVSRNAGVIAAAAGLAVLKYGPDISSNRADRLAHAAVGAAVGYVAGLSDEKSLQTAAGAALLLGPVKQGLDRNHDSRDAASSMWGVGLGYQVARTVSRSEPPDDEKEKAARCNPSWDNPGLEDSGILHNVASTAGLPSGALSGAVLSGLAGASLRPVVAGLVQAAVNDSARRNLDIDDQASVIPAISGVSSGVAAANAASAVIGLSNPAALAVGLAFGAYNAVNTRDEIRWRLANCPAPNIVELAVSDDRR